MRSSDDGNGETKDDDMIYGLTADEREALQSGLRALPDTMPPRVVWRRIREQAEAEGLLRTARRRRMGRWYTGAGLAAAAVLAAVILPQTQTPVTDEFSVVPDNARVSNTVPVTGSTLEALMVESRELEDDLRSLPPRPRLVRAGTQATIVDIEDRIAAIDYQLSDPTIRMSEDDREIFWRERVRLMQSLLRLRYAQSQRTAY